MLEVDKSLAEEAGFNPYYNTFDNKAYIDLASNNYLGLAEHERVKSEAISAIQKYGASMCGTPIATGYTELFKETEERLSQFAGLEETILFPSCYQANNGIFAVLSGRDDLVIVDRLAHSSLIQGIKMSGCKISPFLHNDIDHLESILKRSGNYRQIFVVTESVFSTEGSIAPLDKIAALCEKYGAIPVVDDSHGIGVIGKNGGGVLEHFNIGDFTGIYTASLGKAIANSGGMVSGSVKTIEYLRYYCPQLVYSTAVTPAVLGGINGALDVIASDFDNLSRRMWSYKQLIYDELGSLTDKLSESESPINAFKTGGAVETLELAKRLFENGIYVTPFIAPSVPKNCGVVRMIAGVGLTEEQVRCAIKKIKDIIS